MTSRIVRAPRGAKLNCKGWHQEAALRCLMNNLDPEVAERPEDLVVYGGAGKAARNWAAFDAIVRELKQLEADETLLVQSGKPVAVFRTHDLAPRVLIANSNFVGTLTGRLVVSGGMGGMGGAQPLAATMNGAVFLGIEVDQARIERRIQTRYCDRIAFDLDEALRICEDAREQGRALSVGLVGNCAEVLPELVRRSVQVDAVTDQTSAHDPLNGYVPAGLSLAEAAELRAHDPQGYVARAMQSMAQHVEAMLALKRAGA